MGRWTGRVVTGNGLERRQDETQDKREKEREGERGGTRKYKLTVRSLGCVGTYLFYFPSIQQTKTPNPPSLPAEWADTVPSINSNGIYAWDGGGSRPELVKSLAACRD